uniref:Inositol-pentakisphosphate 2-kinase n=1 Tax=Photinus pyralis TaxID=7054 RepID=A0A1Y1LB51_PHOPY
MDREVTDKNLNRILTKGWLYRGEGNANVVLSLPSCHKILRIKKCDKPQTILQWFLFWIMEIFHWDITSDMQQEKRDLDFYNLIMVPLLGSWYTQPAVSIETTKGDIKKLEFELANFRPEKRKHKGLKVGMASIFVDYAFLPTTFNSFCREGVTYAVEIKPKKGFMEDDRVIDKCQFCVKQYLKIKNQQIKKLSSYCPLDLFSGDTEKICRALKALISNPQNNLRIFCNGVYYYGENTSQDKFYTMLNELFECSDNEYDSTSTRNQS